LIVASVGNQISTKHNKQISTDVKLL